MVAQATSFASAFGAAWIAAAVLVASSAADDGEPRAKLQQAIAAAQESRRPIFVVAGSQSCPYCRLLEKEMQDTAVRREAKRWTVVALDVDQSPDDAEALAVRVLPALRLLTPAGKVAAAREGMVSAPELVEWLQTNFDAATGALTPELTASGELTALQAVRLARELGRRDSTVREAAIRRLLANPEIAAAPVASAMVDGSLATRLAALEILATWKAPVEGLDPWRPETITQQRLEAISAWAAEPTSASARGSVVELSDSLSQSVAESIRQMLIATAPEATAIRERLARYGRLLLPLVYEQLRTAEADDVRQRLTALRYRLVASDELALGWPGGIERLAAADARTRHRAMEELAARASGTDESLLLELFSDPEPLIRELALQALYKTGGSKANSALVRLLDDPEPNVQAAVLKQLAEAPAHSALPRLRTYITKQQDSDLLVHAVRVLRATKSKSAVECLVGLLSHESWRVRAEAAEAIGEAAGDYNSVADEDKADAYVALIELLGDEDSFVVSRAVQVLAKARLAIAVNPLAEVASRHPSLAIEVVKALAHSDSAQLRVAEHLRGFAKSSDPKVRAAAVKGLCEVNPDQLEVELESALTDQAAAVRIAAAEGLFQLMTAEFERNQVAELESESATPSSGPSAMLGSGLESLRDLFFPGKSSTTNEPGADAQSTADLKVSDAPVKLPQWMRQLEQPLQKMIVADSAGERLAAALPLAALGQHKTALPVLETAVQNEQGQIPTAARALRWLHWTERQRLFALLIERARGNEDIAVAAGELAERPHPAAAALLWELLARPDAGGQLTNSLVQPLRELYMGDRWFNLESLPKKQVAKVVAEMTKRSKSGSQWQRMAALVFLVSLDSAAAAEVATQIAGDETLDPRLRSSAFQVVLYASEDDVAQKEAILALRSGSDDRKKQALAFLAQGRSNLPSLDEDAIQLFHLQRDFYGPSTPEQAIPAPPKGLTADLLLPLVRSGEAPQRANAGYLLCLMGEIEGLAPLVEYWKAHGRKDEQLSKLVYRSVAALDDASQVWVLAEIYQSLANADRANEHEVAAFYWTIRGMTGPEILALRKRIRDEVGLDTLQQNNPFGDTFRSSPF